MRRLVVWSLAVLSAGLLPACGGGGGGDDPAPCTKPGTLRALAFQGASAPGTSGVFGSFTAGMLMDTAAGGWSVFTATTSDAGAPRGCWVAQPDGTALLVFRAGETVPDAGGGVIQDFSLVRTNAAGHVLAGVTLTGDSGGRTFGLLSAQVVGGAVVAKHDVVYHLRDTSASGLAGLLADIDESRVVLTDDGRIFFAGTTASAEALWVVNIDGSGLAVQVKTGDALPQVGSLTDLQAIGVSRNGNRYACVGSFNGSYPELLLGGDTGGTFSTIAKDTDGLGSFGGGSILSVHAGGPLLVYDSGSVLWKAQGDRGGLDDVLLLGSRSEPFTAFARTDGIAPSTGGAQLGALDLLQHEPEGVLPMFRAQLVGTSNGVDFATFGIGSSLSLAFFEGRAAPADLGQSAVFTDTLPGLGAAPSVDIARDGGFAFAGLLTNGTSGVFWLLPGCGFFTVAHSGGGAPGGDTFGAFSPSATHTTADGVVLFRANLTTAGSGLFRQGP